MARPARAYNPGFEYDPTFPEVDAEVTFDGSESGPDEDIQSFDWYVQDDWHDSGKTTTATFTSEGEYEVRLTVDYVGEGTKSTSQTVVVGNERPVAEFIYSPRYPDPGETVALDGRNSEDPDGTIELYGWRIDGSFVSTKDLIEYEFSSEGRHEVTLTVKDNYGRPNRTTKYIEVTENSPTPTPSPTPSPTATPTKTASPTASPTPSPTPSPTEADAGANSDADEEAQTDEPAADDSGGGMGGLLAIAGVAAAGLAAVGLGGGALAWRVRNGGGDGGDPDASSADAGGASGGTDAGGAGGGTGAAAGAAGAAGVASGGDADPETAMERAREHEADGDAAFDDRRYGDAVHAYEQALDAYDEALAAAREVGDQELVDEAGASIAHVEDGIGDARRERAYEDFSSLADTAEYELEEADRLLGDGAYDEAREAYEVARDRASEAIDITEDWGFEDPEHLVDVRSSAASGITDASLTAAEHDIERAKDRRHEAPGEAVAELEAVADRLEEMVLTADRAAERDELLDEAREWTVRCELNAARETIAEAEQLEDAGDLRDAKAAFQEAREQLRDVSDRATERGMHEARETASDLVDTCADGIDRTAE